MSRTDQLFWIGRRLPLSFRQKPRFQALTMRRSRKLLKVAHGRSRMTEVLVCERLEGGTYGQGRLSKLASPSDRRSANRYAATQITSASKVPAALTTISRGGSYADRNNQEPRFSPAVARRHRRAIRFTPWLSACACQTPDGSGVFTPSPEAAKLTRARHASGPSTPVTVRYSDGTGLPNIPDNDPARSGPRGMAIRFHLASTPTSWRSR